MKTKNKKQEVRIRRHVRIRARVFGTEARPRLSVFKSNKYLYAQLINDDASKTLAFVSSQKLGKDVKDVPREVGRELAKLALKKKISAVVFDRGGFIYTGKVKALAEGAREGGLKF